MLTDEDALLAASDPAQLELAVGRCRGWILRAASRSARRYVTESDDEWSVALWAFAEAVDRYDQERGHFSSFAELVIGRRVSDWLRGESRHALEQSVPPGSLEGFWVDGVAPLPEQDAGEDRSLRLEIEALEQALAPYGVDFLALSKASPKAEKTRQACAQAVRWMLENPDRPARLRQSRALPLVELCPQTQLPRKLLERHRKYIIAAVEILSGDYPGLGEYLRFITKGGAP